IVRMRGLPFSVREEDIREFFSGLLVRPHGIFFTSSRDGRPTGEAFVIFERDDEGEKALSLDRKHMGTRYVEVFKSNKPDLVRLCAGCVPAVAPSMPPSLPPSLPPHPHPHSHPMPGSLAAKDLVVKVRGLPYSAKEADVFDFFCSSNVRPSGVNLIQNARGESSGDAYVELGSEEEVMRALALHRSNFGHRYLEIFRTSRAEV
ncbi:hypothetical protein GUITHDRAFT_57099, partial [Guillardia theta CCMP2712]